MIVSDLLEYKNELRSAWAPLKDETLSEWCEREINLPTGPFRCRPYQTEILNSMKSSPFTYVLKSARVGYTQLMLNFLFYNSSEKANPSRNLLVFPDLTACDQFSKNEMTDICADSNSSVWLNDTVRTKKYRGGVTYLIGAQSESAFRRISVDNICIDEISAMAIRSNIMGDVYSLAIKRGESSWRRRVIVGSTPGTESQCRMSELFLSGTQEYFESQCLSCKKHHPLKWEWMTNLSVTDLDYQVHHKCPHCDFEMSHQQKFEFLEQPSAKWVATAPSDKRSFHIWSGYSYDKNCQWDHIREQYHLALKDDALSNVFVNTFLGQTYQQRSEQIDWEIFAETQLDSTDPGLIPDGVICLYGGIDCQKEFFAATVIGFDAKGKWYLIDHQTIETDSDIYTPRAWDYLSDHIKRKYYYSDGAKSLSVRRWALDSGYATSACYEFSRRFKNVSAIKGSSNIERDYVTKPNRLKTTTSRYIELYIIGTHKSKLKAIAEIKSRELSSFPAFEGTYFQALLSEKMISHRGKDRFVKTQTDQEPFDCLLYALFISEVDNVKKRIITPKNVV